MDPENVTLKLTWFWKSARSAASRDYDNPTGLFKSGQDGIAKGLKINDRRIKQLPHTFAIDESNPRVEVEVYFCGIQYTWT